MEENNNKEEETRNPDGTFKRGYSGNPNGLPKGTFSLTAMLKRRLEEVPVGQTKSYAEQLVQIILDKGIVDKDTKTINMILSYVDGMPRQRVGIEGGPEGSPLVISVETKGMVDEAIKKFLGVSQEEEDPAE